MYKFYSVYLYDNQLEHDFLLLHNKRIDYSRSSALNRIYQYKGDDKKEYSINLMKSTFESKSSYKEVLFIENKGFIKLVKCSGTHLPNYNVYNLYWDENASGVNIHNWDYCSPWKAGSSQCSVYRIHEYKSERLSYSRDLAIQNILI